MSGNKASFNQPPHGCLLACQFGTVILWYSVPLTIMAENHMYWNLQPDDDNTKSSMNTVIRYHVVLCEWGLRIHSNSSLLVVRGD